MKKLIFRGPVQTASGYGVHARMLLRSLIKSNRFDVTVMSVPWGATPLLYDNTPENEQIIQLAQKFNPKDPGHFDISVQVTIPNEFMKIADVNVCVTAGIETDKVSKLWQEKCNEFADVLVVPSLHSARSFTTGIYGERRGPEQVLLRKPLHVLPEWVDSRVFNTDPVQASLVPAGLDDMPDFNFVSVGLGLDRAEGEDRKNFAQLIRWFCEQFRDNREVGLILKLSMVNYSEVDFKTVRERIAAIKAQAGCGQFPRIKLIHGRLSDGELAALYKHDKVKAFITTTHGEGYGLPIIEAAACGLPVLATNWSGHLDFLKIDGKNRFVPLECELKPIPDGSVWDTVLERGTKWAYPIEHDVKLKMAKVVLSYDKPKQWAAELAEHIAKNINEKLGDRWADDVYQLACGETPRGFKNYMPDHELVQLCPTMLPDVTLVAVSGFKLEQTISALKNSLKQICPKEVKFISDEDEPTRKHTEYPPIKWTRIEDLTLTSVLEYDYFVSKKLHEHVNTSHALVVQWDGYVLNRGAWDPKFLEYDYVGAPWFWNNVVGNSGFALFSKRLLEELAKEEYVVAHPFDTKVCIEWREKLEQAGFKFAPPELASKFSVENLPYTGQFGWHGENPFCGER